jgi:hypothetical protein
MIPIKLADYFQIHRKKVVFLIEWMKNTKKNELFLQCMSADRKQNKE